MKKVPLARPDHPDDPAALLATLRNIVLSGRWTQGEYAAAFERRVAEYCGSIYAVATNSGTSALEAICEAVGLKEGTEVICPSYTFIATVNAVLLSGARPVFADIDPATFNLDPKEVESKITDKTRAVILVHQFGIPSDAGAFASLCRKQGLVLIEDAACGLGSHYEGKAVGTFGVSGLLSFHPRKILSTGEGGMVLTDNESLSQRVRSFGNHGRTNSDSPTVERMGHNHRMSEFQAALGLWALDRMNDSIERRHHLARRYDEAFCDVPNVRTVHLAKGLEWNYQSYPIRISGGRRNWIAEELRKKGVETSPGPLPSHTHPYIVHLLQPPRLPETEAAYEETLLLPMYAAMEDDDQAYVIQTLRQALG